MDISVIVTVYNIKSYIRECIESILSQKDVEFEVICVDDASTDGSDSILDEYKKKDSRIRVLKNLKNEGLASARNKGYRLAGGEYLYNIDGDDLLAEGALYRMHQVMKEHDLDLLAFSAKAFLTMIIRMFLAMKMIMSGVMSIRVYIVDQIYLHV